MEKLLALYNDFFIVGLEVFVFVFTIIHINIFTASEKDKKRSCKVAWRVEIRKTIVSLGVFVFLFCMLEMCLDISIYSIIKENDLYRVIIGILLCYHVHDGKKVFQSLREDDFLDNIEKDRLCNDIKKEVEYWKEWEEEICEQLMLKFDVLKAMAPISLIPVIAGYFLEHSEEIELNLNVYIIVFVVILGGYFVTMIDTYAKLKDKKRMISKMKRKIVKIEDEARNNKRDC